MQQAIFKEIMRLSKNGAYISIQELDHLGFTRAEMEETLIYFEKYGLFSSVQHMGAPFPVVFAVKA